MTILGQPIEYMKLQAFYRRIVDDPPYQSLGFVLFIEAASEMPPLPKLPTSKPRSHIHTFQLPPNLLFVLCDLGVSNSRNYGTWEACVEPWGLVPEVNLPRPILLTPLAREE